MFMIFYFEMDVENRFRYIAFIVSVQTNYYDTKFKGENTFHNNAQSGIVT